MDCQSYAKYRPNETMSQCKALYKDHSETIMGNMDSIVFLGGREASTLKGYFGKLAGQGHHLYADRGPKPWTV